mmetsp:Transcript_27508/g.58792  ORF Transcript_27508/g.58792 Transcript_27508/m.58792 type:complete len:105 (-) Transcript_27508:22-336(-)
MSMAASSRQDDGVADADEEALSWQTNNDSRHRNKLALLIVFVWTDVYEAGRWAASLRESVGLRVAMRYPIEPNWEENSYLLLCLRLSVRMIIYLISIEQQQSVL